MTEYEKRRANELKEKMIEAIKNVIKMHLEPFIISPLDILKQVKENTII